MILMNYLLSDKPLVEVDPNEVVLKPSTNIVGHTFIKRELQYIYYFICMLHGD